MQFKSGDIFATGAQTLVNPVNCRGVMGAGLAKAFATRFPEIMAPYKAACTAKQLVPGNIQAIRLDPKTGQRDPEGSLTIINFPTKDDWRDESRLEWIEAGAAKLAKFIELRGVKSIAIPQIGCGLGGLDWPVVREVLIRHLEPMAAKGVEIVLLGPAPELVRDAAKPATTKPAIAKPAGTPDAVALEATMYFRYGQERRPGVTADSTFEAILLGERTSTTRFDIWAGTERWGRLPAGSRVRFFEDKEKTGRHVDVIVDSVKRIDLSSASSAELDDWSAAEGWSVEHARAISRGRGPGYQIRYHMAEGEYARLATPAAMAASHPGVGAPAKPGAAESDIPMANIDVRELQGEFRSFSNMHKADVLWGDAISAPRLWPSTETAYVAAKTLDPAIRQKVLDTYAEAEAVKPGSGGGAVKRFGRTIRLRPDWDGVKDQVMLELVRDKFNRHAGLAAKLLATGAGMIEEGNRWHDTYWGVALEDVPNKRIRAGQGQNKLGKILMQVRQEIHENGRVVAPLAAALAAAPAAAITKAPTTDHGIRVINVKSLGLPKGAGLPGNVVDCSRYGKVTGPGGFRLGNQFVMYEHGGKDGTRDEVIRKKTEELVTALGNPEFRTWLGQTLKGKDLGCYCCPKNCHAEPYKAAAEAILDGRDPIAAVAPYLKLGLEPQAGTAQFRKGSRQADMDAHHTKLTQDLATLQNPNAGKSFADELKARMSYAGIGRRETPPHILERMEEIGRLLGAAGLTLRSGGADGADSAFERGCIAAGGSKRIYLPKKGFNANPSPLHADPSPEMLALAQKYHPAWHRCSPDARKLHARNGCQVLGDKLDDPARVIICWTKDGAIAGGTGQALRIAQGHGVPVINLGSLRWRDSSASEIAAAAMNPEQLAQMVPPRPSAAHSASQPAHQAGAASGVVSAKANLDRFRRKPAPAER